MNRLSKTLAEQWEQATLANNFLFCKILSKNPEICKTLLEILLHIKISKISMPQSEKTPEVDYGSKGIRFNIYTTDENNIYDIEVQTTNTGELPKRARYYQGLMDVDNLQAGMDYNELKESYVIFLCTDDFLGRGLPVYSFENYCSENKKIKLGDKTHKIFFIATFYDKMATADEKSFFEFLKTGKSSSLFTDRLSQLVSRAKKNAQWRHQYMTYEMTMTVERNRARREGLAEGRAEGILEATEEITLKNAKIMLADNMDEKLILKYTGISPEKLKELQSLQK